MTVYIDPKRYAGVRVGPLADMPEVATVPEGQIYVSTDEGNRGVYAKELGAWVQVADLTASIAWASIENKPDAFPPEEHDLETGHSGTLRITRIMGHDEQTSAHIEAGLVAALVAPLFG